MRFRYTILPLPTSTTVDPLAPDSREDAGTELVPSIELLFHPSLARIGGATLPEAFAAASGSLVLGRDAPAFVDPATGEQAPPCPLADPCVSRRHLVAVWQELERCFDVRLHENARLPVHVLGQVGKPCATGGIAAPESLQPGKPVRLAPGSLLAIGNRALLLLLERPRRSSGADRLDMIGESEAVWVLRERIQRVASFRENVLVVGETGSGKERVARALHRCSARRGGFVAVNVSQLDPELANAELFGHARGAFTDARRDRAGAFELAQGGTLFLDEIGDAAPAVQQRLLRVLEERCFTRVGDGRPIEMDVRVVAATNRDLSADVGSGRFRLDLFERLNPLRVEVPPLRARIEDVPRLLRETMTFHLVDSVEEVLDLALEDALPRGGRIRDALLSSRN